MPAVILLLILLVISSCATIPADPPLPDRSSPKPVSRGITGEVSPSPDGRFLLYQKGNRLLLSGETGGTKVVLDSLPPGSVIYTSWSPDGNRFLVTLSKEGKGSVELRTVADELIARWERGEILGRGGWISPDEFLVPALKMTTYRFGVDLRQIMLRFRADRTPPAEVVLHSATIRPSIFKRYGDSIMRGFVISPHPLGDTILFTRFHDPPEFTPYRKIMLLHLESGEQTEAGSTPLDAPPPIFTGTDDVILAADSSSTFSIDPWRRTKSLLVQKTGEMACARDSSACLVAGDLILGKERLTSFPAESRGSFSDDGALLVVTYRGDAYSLSFPRGTIIHPPDGAARRDRLRYLRNLRAKRLISPEEFSAMTSALPPEGSGR